MSIKGPNNKQRKYAFNRMNQDMTKQDAALDAGYSATSARVPAKIEATRGFHLAMAQLAGQTGNVAMKILHVLNARDLSKESTTTLMQGITTLSNAWDKFVPKENNPIDTSLNSIFAIVGNDNAPDELDTQEDNTPVLEIGAQDVLCDIEQNTPHTDDVSTTHTEDMSSV